MADVFISYSSSDKPVADAIVGAIEQAGVECWYAPRDIPPASNYAEEIMNGIEQCRVMVVMLSSHANESEHVFREVERAVNRGLPIFPLRIEDVLPSKRLELFLSSSQWVDAFPGSIDSHTERLTQGIKTLLGRSGPVRRRPSTPPVASTKWKRVAAIVASVLALAAAAWLVWKLVPRPPTLTLEIGGESVDPGRVRLIGSESLVLCANSDTEIAEDALLEHTGFDVTSSMTSGNGRKWTLQQKKPLQFEFEARFVVKGERRNGVLTCVVKRELIDSAVGVTKIGGELVGNATVVTVKGWEADVEITSLTAREYTRAFASLVDDTGAVVVKSVPLANANDSGAVLIGHLTLPTAARREGGRFLLEVTAEDSVGSQRTAKPRRPQIEFASPNPPAPPDKPPELSLEIRGKAVDPRRVTLYGDDGVVLCASSETEIAERALLEHAGFDVVSSTAAGKGRKWTLQQQRPLRFDFEARFVVKGERRNGVLTCVVKRELVDEAVGVRKINGKAVGGDETVVTVSGWEADIELSSLPARKYTKAFVSLVDETGAVVVKLLPLANARDSESGLVAHVVVPPAARREGKRFLLEVTAEDSVGSQRTAKTRRPQIEFTGRTPSGPGPRTPLGTYVPKRDPANPCRYTVDVRGLGVVSVTKVFIEGASTDPKLVMITPPWSRTTLGRVGVRDGQNPWSGSTPGLNGRRDVDGEWILDVEARDGEDCRSVSVTTLRIEYVR